MWKITAASLAFVLALLPFAAPAGEPAYVAIEQRLTAEQRRATGIDTLSAEQLRLLNDLLRDAAAADARAAPAKARDTQASVAAAGTPPATRNFVGLQDGPIKARLKGSIGSWAPGTVFELDNGQRWQVLKGEMTLRKPLDAPEILVVPGIAGRWFLQVDEDAPKARVFRID